MKTLKRLAKSSVLAATLASPAIVGCAVQGPDDFESFESVSQGLSGAPVVASSMDLGAMPFPATSVSRGRDDGYSIKIGSNSVFLFADAITGALPTGVSVSGCAETSLNGSSFRPGMRTSHAQGYPLNFLANASSVPLPSLFELDAAKTIKESIPLSAPDVCFNQKGIMSSYNGVRWANWTVGAMSDSAGNAFVAYRRILVDLGKVANSAGIGMNPVAVFADKLAPVGTGSVHTVGAPTCMFLDTAAAQPLSSYSGDAKQITSCMFAQADNTTRPALYRPQPAVNPSFPSLVYFTGYVKNSAGSGVKMFVARADKKDLFKAEGYSFWTGLSTGWMAGDTGYAAAAPVKDGDNNDVILNSYQGTISYNAYLGKYTMTDNTAPVSAGNGMFKSDAVIRTSGAIMGGWGAGTIVPLRDTAVANGAGNYHVIDHPELAESVSGSAAGKTIYISYANDSDAVTTSANDTAATALNVRIVRVTFQ